eukprot:4835891-Pyramimonas_sp.AAC.1
MPPKGIRSKTERGGLEGSGSTNALAREQIGAIRIEMFVVVVVVVVVVAVVVVVVVVAVVVVVVVVVVVL